MIALLSLVALAAEPGLSPAEYASRFPIRDASDPDYVNVESCLRAWPGHPFATPESRRFRVVESAVRVMGFGSAEVTDLSATSYPQIILIRPNVSVMTKTTWTLANPNGWYCFDSSVAVMAKGLVALGCGAHLADAQASVEVLGGSRAGGVSVLGSMPVQRTPGCPPAPAPIVTVPVETLVDP